MTAVDDRPTAETDLFERPVRPVVGPRGILRDLGPRYAANGLIGLVFSCTGPVAVILAAGAAGGLSAPQLASWIFGVFALNGLLTIVMSVATGNRSGSSGPSPAPCWSAGRSPT